MEYLLDISCFTSDIIHLLEGSFLGQGSFLGHLCGVISQVCHDPESIDFSSKFFDTGCRKYSKLRTVLGLKELY